MRARSSAGTSRIRRSGTDGGYQPISRARKSRRSCQRQSSRDAHGLRDAKFSPLRKPVPLEGSLRWARGTDGALASGDERASGNDDAGQSSDIIGSWSGPSCSSPTSKPPRWSAPPVGAEFPRQPSSGRRWVSCLLPRRAPKTRRCAVRSCRGLLRVRRAGPRGAPRRLPRRAVTFVDTSALLAFLDRDAARHSDVVEAMTPSARPARGCHAQLCDR